MVGGEYKLNQVFYSFRQWWGWGGGFNTQNPSWLRHCYIGSKYLKGPGRPDPVLKKPGL